MPDLNIRNVSKETMRDLKVRAAEAGVTLRQYCLAKLNVEGWIPVEESAENYVPGWTAKPICVMKVKGWDKGTPGVSIACPIHIPGHVIPEPIEKSRDLVEKDGKARSSGAGGSIPLTGTKVEKVTPTIEKVTAPTYYVPAKYRKGKR